MKDKSTIHYLTVNVNLNVKVYFSEEITEEEALELYKEGEYEDAEMMEINYFLDD